MRIYERASASRIADESTKRLRLRQAMPRGWLSWLWPVREELRSGDVMIALYRTRSAHKKP
mgnify:CR=1 FL=1